MNCSPKYVVVSTAIDSEQAARDIAARIVEERLAACVQCSAVHSTYRWKGKQEASDEYLLRAKTRSELTDDLMAFIKSLHSYDLPEIIVTPIITGSNEYLEWVRAETER